jgi:hypothetical protein
MVANFSAATSQARVAHPADTLSYEKVSADRLTVRESAFVANRPGG